MASTSKPLQLGRRRLCRISYYCDLQHRSGNVIPLGVIAEITRGSFRGLGLIARTQLLDSELQDVGALIRARLANPFDLLREEFDWAWAKVPAGSALNALAERHTDSLFFSTPTLSGIAFEVAEAEGKLHALLNREFAALLRDTLTKRNVEKIAPRKSAILKAA